MRRLSVLAAALLLFAGCGDDGTTTPETGDTFDPGNYQLAGRIDYNGMSIAQQTSVTPSFWFRDETSGAALEGVETYYDTDSGWYGLNDLPAGATVGISVAYQVNGQEETHPGNYRSWTTADLATLSSSAAHDYTIDAYEIMRLYEPFDNTGMATFDTYPQHASPLRFTWKEVAGAVQYEVLVTENGDAPYQELATVFSQSLTDTTVTVTLDPSDPQTHYEFHLNASDGRGVRVGSYMTSYSGGYGWDYRFTISGD